ncbi:MAG: hypothetical protein IJ598_02620 [Ruminococcus sp.]|nr:hypothetical protein [Ruminococcus sp.]
MSYFQRIKSLLTGILFLLVALFLYLVPKEGYSIVTGILSISMLVYGFRLLWFYLTMSRHMVGGKSCLYQAIIVIDVALFTSTIAFMNSVIVVFYLTAAYAFTGLIDILRAVEAKKIGAPNWKWKFVYGITKIILTALLVIFGLFHGKIEYLVYGYCLNLSIAAVSKIIQAFRRTSIVYIQ